METDIESKGGLVDIPKNVRSVYEEERAAKFLATLSREGIPNVALIVSQLPGDDNQFMFGEFMMVKTLENLKSNPSVASVAITEKLEMAGYRGNVMGWVQSGPFVEKINSIPFFRYNAYAGIHNVAVVEIEKIVDLPMRVTYSTLAKDYVSLLMASRLLHDRGSLDIEFPLTVREKFNSIMSIKVIAFPDENEKPAVFPALSTRFTGTSRLAFKVTDYNKKILEFPLPLPVAMNVLTLDLLTYQVKGELVSVRALGGSRFGIVELSELYSSMPPLCGERII